MWRQVWTDQDTKIYQDFNIYVYIIYAFMVLYLCQRIKIFSIIDHGYLFISKFIIYSRLDSDHHSVSMHGLFWGVGAALRPLPRPRPRCCWLAGV